MAALIQTKDMLTSCFNFSQHICSGIPPGGADFILYNPLGWVRDEAVVVAVPVGMLVLDHTGAHIDSQCTMDPETGASYVAFLARGLPPLGFSTYKLVPGPCLPPQFRNSVSADTPLSSVSEGSHKWAAEGVSIANEYVRLNFTGNGTLLSWTNKITNTVLDISVDILYYTAKMNNENAW